MHESSRNRSIQDVQQRVLRNLGHPCRTAKSKSRPMTDACASTLLAVSLCLREPPLNRLSNALRQHVNLARPCARPPEANRSSPPVSPR